MLDVPPRREQRVRPRPGVAQRRPGRGQGRPAARIRAAVAAARWALIMLAEGP